MISSLALTVFPAPLLASFLFTSPAPSAPQDASLVAALPEDTVMAVRLPNPKALLAQRETSDWVAFAMDAQWDVALPKLFLGLDEPEMAAEAAVWRERLLGALGDSTEVVAFASGPFTQDQEPTLGLLVRGGESCASLLRGFMGSDSVEAALAGGQKVSVGEAGRAELYYEKDGLMLLVSAQSVEDSKEAAAACLASLAEGAELAGPFAISGLSRVRQQDAALEVAIDMRPVWRKVAEDQLPSDEKTLAIGGGSGESWALLKEVIEAASSMEWIYMDVGVGLGESMTQNVYVPYDSASMLGDVFSFFGPANTALFNQVPAGAISATVANLDLHGMTEWALGGVKEFSEEVYGQVQGGLATGQAALGLDIVDELIGNMTGDFLGFSSALNPDEEIAALLAIAGSNPTTLVAMIEESDPMLDLVETALALSGMESEFSADTHELGDDGAELDVWEASEALGLPLTVGVGGGRLVVSIDPKAGSDYFERLKGAKSGATITADKAQRKAMESASGSMITWQPTESGADLLEAFGEMLEVFIGEALEEEFSELDDESMEEAFDASSDMIANWESALGELGSLWRDYFSGTVMTEFHLDDGMLRMHLVAR